jgi:hypothetical protein
MQRLRVLSTALALGLGTWAALAGPPAAAAAPASAAQLQALETALNSGAALNGLLETGPGLDPALLELRRRNLQSQFPDLRWRFSPGPPLRNGQPTVQLNVSGNHRDGAGRYRLEASQLLALESSGGRINGQTVIREQSILSSGGEAPTVSLSIPDAVLTGQRYDVDVVLDEPLSGAIAAGGIVALTPEQVAAMESPDLPLGPLGGGGLFKTVQAPLKAGSQTWAVLLVHPQGIISASKRVRVVAEKDQLNP